MREARARESRVEGETRRRANAGAMREARARRIADRGWQTLPVHTMAHPHPLRLGGTHECPHCHAVLLKEEEPSFCCREGMIQLAPLPPLPRSWLEMYHRVAFKTASRRGGGLCTGRRTEFCEDPRENVPSCATTDMRGTVQWYTFTTQRRDAEKLPPTS